MNLRKFTLAWLALALAASQPTAAELAREFDRAYCLTEKCQRYGVPGIAGLYAHNRHIEALLKRREATLAAGDRGQTQAASDLGLRILSVLGLAHKAKGD